MSATGAEAPRPWYDADPERVDWELAEFAARQLPAATRMGLVDGRFDDDLVVVTELTYDGQPVTVEVAYPFDYPDRAPMLYGPVGLLSRHQQPSEGNFCWAEDHDADWWPGTAAAQLVDEDLRWLLEDTEQGQTAVRTGEANMPEPMTGHLHYGLGIVAVPDPFFEKDLPASEGTMTLLGASSPYFLSRAANLGAADAGLQQFFAPHAREQDGYWVNFSPTPPAAQLDSDHGLLALIDERAPRFYERLRRRLKEAKSRPHVDSWLGVTFMEEGPVRGEYRRNWLFAEVRLHRGGGATLGDKLRAQALTLSERERRTPELVGLADARVLLVGAGSLGSPVALELAKAGIGHLDIGDFDSVDVNNSVRHIAGPRDAGSNKALVVTAAARQLNPFVTVQGHPLLGVGGGAGAAVMLIDLVAKSTVVLDTTGSSAVARILQRRCVENARPLVVAGLSAGSYGGEVAVFRPDGPCFECLLLAQRDGTIPQPLAAPRSALVTPIGCSHPAFAGAGFDAAELAALVARTVVQVTATSTYPGLADDWTVVNFRGEPRREAGALPKHPNCPRCS